jgi:hypothetical protein
MKDGLNELSLLAEEGMKWMDDAAQRFEKEASQLDEPEKSKLGLLAAVYYERAGMHQTFVEKLRNTKPPNQI